MQVKAKNGLLVISTSFHDSRRSANQLKGRAGRQGDPGETLTLYDYDDAVLAGDPSLDLQKSKHTAACCLPLLPWCMRLMFSLGVILA